MGKVSFGRPKTATSPRDDAAMSMWRFRKLNRLNVLWFAALPGLFFGMPYLYAAADSFTTQPENKTAVNKAASDDGAHQSGVSLQVEAKASSGGSSTVASTTSGSVSATTNAASPQDSVDVTVNGQTVPVPQSGSVHKHFSSKDGQTVVDVRVEGGGNAQSRSSTSIEINSQSFSSGSETNGGEGRHPDRR